MVKEGTGLDGMRITTKKKANGVPKLKVQRDLDMTGCELTLHQHSPKDVNFSTTRNKKHKI